MKSSRYIAGITILLPVFLLAGCGLQRKLEVVRTSEQSVTIRIPEIQDRFQELKDDYAKRDTLVVTDLEGNEVTLMETLVDEEGNAVAHETLKAAKITARFRNVAERNGRVTIEFDIVVPQHLFDTKWQVRFYPDMYILDECQRLEPLVITGCDYREAQLRGYEHYNRFINSIITDSTRFIRLDALEIFLQRNIPEVFQFKTDSSYVSNEVFYSFYGVSQQKAVDHYTYKMKIRHNNHKESRKDKMFRKYVKAPILYDGIRLDTVISEVNGDIIYRYTQGFKTRPKLRKVDITLSGEIYEEDRLVYSIPETEKLTFYISSISAFVKDITRYKTSIIERRVEANTTANIVFATGKWNIDPSMGENGAEMVKINSILSSLLDNQEYDMDSISVNAAASPEGWLKDNVVLSRKRAESVIRHFEEWIIERQDSLEAVDGFMVDEDGNIIKRKRVEIRFIGREDGENWDDLDRFVALDTVMTDKDKEQYSRHQEIANLDEREAQMKKDGYYRYVRENLYPRLRNVRFDFHMHRKGMVKDTVHTTVVDSVYMNGLQALKDMDYESAVVLLRPYSDYNTAVAYCATGRDASALDILEDEERDAQVNYLLAILYSRYGRMQEAVQCYMHACEQEPSYVHRGNLDPEISALIERYALNKQEEDEISFDL